MPRRTDHLKATQFKPGQSGNPGGKAKGPSLAKTLMRILEMSPEKLAAFEPKTGTEVLALNLYEKAAGSSKAVVSALRTVIERTDGAVPQSMNVNHNTLDPEEFLLDLSGNGSTNGSANGSG